MLKMGIKFKPFKVESWFDCGRKETLLESNATLLKKFARKAESEYNFENTVIIPPVSIGDGCDIKNSIIGPNVTIGENTTIDLFHYKKFNHRFFFQSFRYRAGSFYHRKRYRS